MLTNQGKWNPVMVYAKKEEARRAHILFTLIIVLWIANFAALLVNYIAWQSAWISMGIGLGSIALFIPVVFLFRGKLSTSGYILIILCTLFVTLFASSGQGLRDYILMLYPIIILFAGLMTQQRGLIFSTGLIFASLAWLVIAEMNGWINAYHNPPLNWADLIMAVIFISIAFWAVHLLVSNTPYSLTQTWNEVQERKRKEITLHEDKTLFETIFRSSSIGIAINRMDNGEFTDANASFLNMFGYSYEEVVGHTSSDLNIWADTEERTRLFQELNTHGRVSQFETRFRHKSGEIRYQLVSMEIIELNGEKFILGSTSDITNLKQAEKTLEENEALIRNINNNLTSGMIYQVIRKSDGTRRFTYLSDAVRHMYGVTPQMGLEDASLIYGRVHEEDRNRVQEEEERANQYLSVFKTEARMINPDGSIRWSSFISNPRKMEDGSTCWDGIELDITQRKESEAAHQESEERYSLLAKNISDVIWILDPESFRFTYVSPSVEALRGYTAEEVMTQDASAALTPDSLKLLNQVLPPVMEKFLNGEAVEEYYVNQIEQPCKDGSTVWTETTTQMVRNEKTGNIEIYGVSRNIAKRKKIEEELRASEARYRAIVEDQTEFICRILPDTTIVFVNKAYCQYYNLKPNDILGKSYLDLIPPEYRETSRQNLLALQFPPYKMESEKEVIHIDGKPHWQQWVGRAIINSQGEVAELQYVGRDITEIKKLHHKQQELAALQERQRLARDLHDAVSQTLFSARITSEMLIQKRADITTGELWANIQHFTRLITSALGEMRVLLLELRPENLAKADLSTLINHLADAAGARTTANIHLNIEEKAKIPSEVKVVFYRIVQEALNNAIKHSRCTDIKIKISVEPDGANLTIEDNGLGMEKIIHHEGAKMGLAIMEERAREINALLNITSQPEKGTSISCTWYSLERNAA